jgi:hypothetical protein
MNLEAVLQTEIMEPVYKDKNLNHIFNLFLCTYLNIFQASCPVKYKSMTKKTLDYPRESILQT